jgi:hypothetical protein
MNSILTLGLIGVALIAGVATPDEVNIRKDSAASTGIAVLDTNTDTIHSTVEEQSRHMEALSQMPGFRSAAVLNSRDGQHVILYTQWNSLESLQAATQTNDGKSLKPFGVVYLAIPAGGDALPLSKASSRAILINVISTDPQRIDALYGFWVRGAESYWLHQPDVSGTALHRAADNSTLINIASWTSADAWQNAAQHAAGNFAGAHGVGTSDPKIYDIAAIKLR